MNTIPFKRFGVMPDLSRNAVMDLPMLKEFATLISQMGYNTLLLYMEDTYEIPEKPFFGHLRGRYSQKDLREIDDFCAELGMEVIPCIQTLAHLDTMFKWRQFASIRDTGNILLADDEKADDLIRKMLKSIRSCLRSRIVHVGMDEAHLLGSGKYQTVNGYQPRFEILRRHLEKVCKMAEEEGLEAHIWGDMFFRVSNQGNYYSAHPKVEPELFGELPKNLSVSAWDYYIAKPEVVSEMIRAHQAFGREVWYAGGIWTWKGYAPDNRFSIRCSRVSMEESLKLGVENYYLTMWCEGGSGTSRLMGLPALFACAKIAAGETDEKKIAAEFEETFQIPFHRFIDLDLTEEKHGLTSSGGTVTNPESYLLFNDPLMGKLDSSVKGGERAFYSAYARRLKEYEDHPRFGYLFRSQAALARTLSRKAELTVRTRAAYLAKDKEAMRTIVEKDYAYILKNLKEFITAFRALWLKENRPQGLEVQEARLGGLYARLVSCRMRLQDWLEQDTPIPELEEEVLDFRWNGDHHVFLEGWGNWISAGRV
jgi:hypothetical protein